MVDSMDRLTLDSAGDIAETYGFDKKKIAEAAQLGTVPSWLAVSAGQFIDRAQAANVQGAAGNEPSIAAKTFGIAGQPQQATSGIPQSGIATPMPQGPPQGQGQPMPAAQAMQSGIGQLPNGAGPPTGMARGGIVSFWGGGPVPDKNATAGPQVSQLINQLQQPQAAGGYSPMPAQLPQATGGYSPMPAQIPQGAGGGESLLSRMLPITVYSESRGNPNAVSPKGARGLMQVMPDTGRDPGFGVRPSDGSQADEVRFGQDYLGAMLNKFGSPEKAWAAYNAGPTKLENVMKAHGDDWLANMPDETKKYVAENVAMLNGGGAPSGGGDSGGSGASGEPSLEKSMREMQTAFGKINLEVPEIDFLKEFPKALEASSVVTDQMKVARPRLEAAMAANDEKLSPEYRKEQEEKIQSEALLTMGASLMSSSGPGGFLGALGMAVKTALPGYKENTKDLDKQIASSLQQNAQLENITVEDQLDRLKVGMEFAMKATGYKTEQRNTTITQRIEAVRLATQLTIAEQGDKASLAAARARAQAAGVLDPTELFKIQLGQFQRADDDLMSMRDNSHLDVIPLLGRAMELEAATAKYTPPGVELNKLNGIQRHLRRAKEAALPEGGSGNNGDAEAATMLRQAKQMGLPDHYFREAGITAADYTALGITSDEDKGKAATNRSAPATGRGGTGGTYQPTSVTDKYF